LEKEQDIYRMIYTGKLHIGMTQDEVVALIGKPTFVPLVYRGKSTADWTYGTRPLGMQFIPIVGSNVLKGDQVILTFKNGKLEGAFSASQKMNLLTVLTDKAQNREYIPEKPKTSDPTTFSSGATRIVTWDFSDVKSAPGNNFSSTAKVRKGDKLTIMEQSGEWVRVRLENGQEGWIRSEVLE